jgi:hypothetical protein
MHEIERRYKHGQGQEGPVTPWPKLPDLNGVAHMWPEQVVM